MPLQQKRPSLEYPQSTNGAISDQELVALLNTSKANTNEQAPKNLPPYYLPLLTTPDMILHFQASGPLSDVIRTGLAPTYHTFRAKRPETKADQSNICLALAHSYRYFYFQLGFRPEKTDLRGSFAAQYEKMQGEYRRHLIPGMDPVLYEPWGDWRMGFDDWDCAWDTLGTKFGGCVIYEQRMRS